MRDAAIHRVLREADWFVCSFTGPSGSPRADALAMTSVVRTGSVRFGYNTIFVIARRERSERRGNPLHAMGAYGQCEIASRLTVDRHGLTPSR